MSAFIDKSEFVVCECHSLDHMFRLVAWNWEKEPGPQLVLEVHLIRVGFWRRLWRGIAYAFGRKSRFGGDWDEVFVSPSDARRMRALLDEYLRVLEANAVHGHSEVSR